MKYIALLYGDPEADPDPVPGTPEFMQMLSDYQTATEIKEQLGGYYILDCEDLDTALRYAAMIPAARYGSVEVRPAMVMGPP
jgi:YCII-related domain